MELLYFILLIIVLFGLIRLLLPVFQWFAIGITVPVLAGYYLFFVPQKRQEVLLLLKVLAIPILIPLLPFIVSIKHIRQGNQSLGFSLLVLWTLTYIVLFIGFQAPV